jgi:trimeric autotransporter adhesin
VKNRNRILVAITSALACFSLLPRAQAVCPEVPDAALPGGNTAEGQLALGSLTTGFYNSAFGIYSLLSLTDGNFNTGIGAGTLLVNLADENTATGAGALLSNIGGSSNTATGAFALFNNVGLGAASDPTGIFFGSFNTANGDRALFSNTNGNSNTATGAGALTENTTGSANTAVGISALSQNTTADQNTAIGAVALFDNTTGTQNTAVGFSALHDNSTGDFNTAIGADALGNNTTGNLNTANGVNALNQNTTGATNTANGVNALASNVNGSANTANGYQALLSNTTGTGNTALGFTAGLNITGGGNVCIGRGMEGVAGVDDTTWIKNIYTTVQPVVGTDPDVVTINSDGRLGRANVSSRRYKHDIKPMHEASEAIYALKPVSFRYNKQYDATQTIAFGLIAEDVAEVYPDLVGRNREGQPQSVRYEQINAMLLNEFLKEHKKVEEQQATIGELKSTVAQQQKGLEILTADLKEQAAQIRKVSAQVQMTKPAAKVALSNP